MVEEEKEDKQRGYIQVGFIPREVEEVEGQELNGSNEKTAGVDTPYSLWSALFHSLSFREEVQHSQPEIILDRNGVEEEEESFDKLKIDFIKINEPSFMQEVWTTILDFPPRTSRPELVRESNNLFGAHRIISNVYRYENISELSKRAWTSSVANGLIGAAESWIQREKMDGSVPDSAERGEERDREQHEVFWERVRLIVSNMTRESTEAFLMAMAARLSRSGTESSEGLQEHSTPVLTLVDHATSPGWAVESIQILLAEVSKEHFGYSRERHRDGAGPSMALPPSTRLLPLLIRKALEGLPVDSLVEAIFLRTSSYRAITGSTSAPSSASSSSSASFLSLRIRGLMSSYADLLVGSFPEGLTVAVCDALANVWGDPTFVNRGNVKLQKFITAGILSCLSRLSAYSLRNRDSSVDEGRPLLLVTLSRGVSTYLDATDRDSRLCGMSVARDFSAMLGKVIHFQDLVDEEMKLQEESRVLERKEDEKEKKIYGRRQSELLDEGGRRSDAEGRDDSSEGSSGDSSDSSSDDDGFEPYDLTGTGLLESKDGKVEGKRRNNDRMRKRGDSSKGGESDGKESVKNDDDDNDEELSAAKLVPYLRVCLQMMQSPESDPEHREKYRAALLSIPKILSINPSDGEELCAPLVRELLRSSAAFDSSVRTKDGISTRDEALKSLCVQYPQIAVPTIMGSISGNTMVIGAKVQSIALLADVAIGLSQYDPLQSLPQHQSQSDNVKDKASSLSLEASLRSKYGDKTTVKRPAKLAAIIRRTEQKEDATVAQRTKYYKQNNFAPLARHTFAGPVMQLLTSSVLTSNAVDVGTNAIKATDSNYCSNDTIAASSLLERILREDESLNLMVPSQCLMTLAVFNSCSLNTVEQRWMYLETLKLSWLFREAKAFILRHAAYLGIHGSVTSWAQSKARSLEAQREICHRACDSIERQTMSQMYTVGPLEALSDVLGQRQHSFLSGQIANNGEDDAGFIEVLDWCACMMDKEANPDCRDILCEIVKIGIQAFEN